MHTHVSVDVEADGPCPALFSMIELGAVVIDGPDAGQEYHTFLRPLDGADWKQSALTAIGVDREATLRYDNPAHAMDGFAVWVEGQRRDPKDRIILVTDNPVFDGMFLSYYFHRFCGRNPFSWSALSLTSLYKGHMRNLSADFRPLRTKPHTHNAVQDARGNAGAFLAIVDQWARGDPECMRNPNGKE